MFKKAILTFIFIISISAVYSQGFLFFKQKSTSTTKTLSPKKQAKKIEAQKKQEEKSRVKAKTAAKKNHYNMQGSTPAGRKRKKQMKKMERKRKKGKY